MRDLSFAAGVLLAVWLTCGFPAVRAALGGVGQFSLGSGWAAGGLHVVLLGVGALVALPLVDREDTRSSLAVGAALAVGVVELLLDAAPGIVLRLETHLTVPWFNGPGWLADQQGAGGILWTVAEVLDLPFLVLTVLQWIRVERREAARVDAALDEAEPTGEPWWMADPALRARVGPSAGPRPGKLAGDATRTPAVRVLDGQRTPPGPS